MHYTAVKNIAEFVMFRHIVSDSIDWMERPFPDVPSNLTEVPKFVAGLKLWLSEFLHDGPKLTAEILFALHTFFRVSDNLGMLTRISNLFFVLICFCCFLKCYFVCT